MAGAIPTSTAIPAPLPGTLALPEEQNVVESPLYRVPEEFISRDGASYFDVDTTPPFNFGGWSESPFDGFGNVTRTLMSIGGLNNSPRNVLRFFSHPVDYATGQYETKLLTAKNPRDYTSFVDEKFSAAQTAVALIVIGGSTLFYAWNESKNMDGSGRMAMLPFRNAAGSWRPGAYLQNTTSSMPIFLVGGSLTAQKRYLQDHDGMSSLKAYLVAGSPKGWYLSMVGGDKDQGQHDFKDYMYADTAGGMPGDIMQTFVGREANIFGVSLYGGVYAKDLQPFLQQAYTTAQNKVAELTAALASAQASSAETKKITDELEALKKATEGWRAIVSTAEARRLALNAAKEFGGEGPHISQLEKARNLALEITDEEKLAAQGSWLKGLGLQYANGRWKAVWPRYAAKTSIFWFYNALNYHFVWGKSWEEAFRSSASVFITVVPNEPWVQMLKTKFGVEKMPQFVEVLPSRSVLYLGWSVNVWDRDMNLKRCQAQRANLVQSLDPEFREKTRQRIAELYQHANAAEKKVWAKPVSEGGCGIVPN